MSGFFGQNDLLPLQLCKALFIGRDDRGIGRVHDAIQQRHDLLVHLMKLALPFRSRAVRLPQAHIPCVMQHRLCQMKKLVRGLDAFQDVRESTFQLGAGDRFAFGYAAACFAAVIGIVLSAPFRPRPGHRIGAIAAQDKAAQREVLIEVLTGGGASFTIQILKYRLIGLETDKRVMMAFAQ